uniref:Uncharacterized protein n=1 Tax=Opuntia streptacantha TaxID=393608 RepID=A0A7C8ZNH7_OPUST
MICATIPPRNRGYQYTYTFTMGFVSSLHLHYGYSVSLEFWRVSRLNASFESSVILHLSRTTFPSLNFWFLSRATMYFHPRSCPQLQQKISATVCIPDIISLSSSGPTDTFTPGKDIISKG